MTEYSPLDQSTKSTHKCEVVIVHPQVHPNADKLEVVEVYGYSVCVGKGDFKDGDLGVYIPPDSIVPQRPEFSFVWEKKGYISQPVWTDGIAVEYEEKEPIIPEKYRRIKAKILRGIVSEGLLMPVNTFSQHPGIVDVTTSVSIPWAKVGDDVAIGLGITHYNPPEPTSLAGDAEVAPNKLPKKRGRPKTLKGWVRFIWHKLFPKPTIIGHEENTGLQIPNYDIDSWQRYKYLLPTSEHIWITEKIHGANCKFTYMNDRMYVGSHYQWKKDIPGSVFWIAMRQNPWIEIFCREHPGFVLYGELVPTQSLSYGQPPKQYRVFGFDVLDPSQKTLTGPQGKWLNYEELFRTIVMGKSLLDTAYWVPIVALCSYDETSIRQYTDGMSLVPGANHIREGIVIRPIVEMYQPRFGRVILKLVSPAYLASKHSG